MDKAEQPTITQADREAAEAVSPAFHRIAGQSASCDLGVGCDEAGVCYAMANGKPEMCHRTTSPAAQDGLVAALQDMTDHYVRLIDSGDAGSWNPRDEPVVQRALAALSAIKEQHHD